MADTMPEPIAVIGMSCRFPGGATQPSRLWKLLSEGTSAWGEVPEGRFNMKAFHHAGDPHPSTTNTPGGHFLDSDVGAFDCRFFEIKPSEAQALDPQQRLTLELAYEAFEDAGLTLPQLWGSSTGVYVGQWSSDYSEILARDPEYQELYHTIGTGPAITSNRVSYFFNLRGPSFTVDTGCSASLVALHSAVQSLRSGESKMSLVGGVNLLLDPQRFTYQSKLKMFSPDGRSYSFDDRANGYGRGEGCGSIVLKPLAQALEDGDHIRAVIRNSALNQDGRTPRGISVPSGEAQEELIRRAYNEVNLDPTETDYVEAHGTGTAVGDPIEAEAIYRALGVPRSNQQDALVVASVKGNIGHTESAAGIAGVIKAVLMLENQAIPPQVNYEQPNPAIPLQDWNIKIPTTLEPKPLKRISVNSFGYGGTNAHVILERAEESLRIPNGSTNSIAATNGYASTTGGSSVAVNGTLTNGINGMNGDHATNGHASNGHATNGHSESNEVYQVDDTADRPRVFLVSGSEERTCHENAKRLAQYVDSLPFTSEEESFEFIDRLAITLNKRTIHDYNTAVIAYDKDDLLAQLEILQQTPIAIRPPFKHDAKVGLVFGGQGAQYHNMAREMMDDWPVFRSALDRAAKHLASLGCQWNVRTELSHQKAQDSHVDEPEYGQTLSTTVQLALVDVLASLGLPLQSTVGHSSGEIAAAYAVGALTFEDALTVAYHRGRLTSKLIATGVSGGMLAVGASPEDVQPYVEKANSGRSSGVKIACFNSPKSVTLSGSAESIDAVADLLQADDVFNRKLKTNGAAYHSSMMQAMEAEYKDAISHIQPRPLSGSMMSSLLGKKLPAGYILDAHYWAQNLISPVLFSGALRGMIIGDVTGTHQAPDVDVLLEVGPHAQMQGAVKEVLHSSGSAAHVKYISCLKRKTNAAENMLRAVAELFAFGAPIDLHGMNANFTRRLPRVLNDVPPYAFNHEQRHWHEGRVSREFTHRQFLPHELLGNLSADVNHTEPKWRRFLRLKELPWLQHHIVQDQVIFPAAGYLTMALEAMRRFTAFKGEESAKSVVGYTLSNCSFAKALVLKEGDTDTEIVLSLRPEVQSARGSWQDWKEFRVFSTSANKDWSEHCRGRIRAVVDESILAERLTDAINLKEQTVGSLLRHITPNRFYATARQVGMEWYAPFDNVTDIQGTTDACVTTNKMPGLLASSNPFGPSTYLVHPGMLDSTLFHGICASLLVEGEIRAPVVPVFLEKMTVATSFEVVEGTELRTFALARQEGSSWSAQIELDQKAIISVHGMRTAQLPGDVDLTRSRQLAHRPEWVADYPTMTRAQIWAQCQNGLAPGSSRNRNVALNANVRDHVERALQQVKADQVAHGYQQAWYQWLQSFVAATPETPEVVAEARAATVNDESVAFKAVDLVGENLVHLLAGSQDPIALLQPNDLLGRMYSEERNARCYHQINEYCKTLGLHNPSLQVLEVGGGTASATLPLLDAMSHHGHSLIGQYDFTDLSTAFFPTARERLAKYKNIVTYRAFDLATAPDVQGYDIGTYDVVIACNVVHATPNIAESLANIRQLLKPGGVLILMEITKPEPYYQLVFGSLPGWWSGLEEGRVESAIIPEQAWQEELVKQGFESEPVIVSDYAEGEGNTISVFFAKAPSKPRSESAGLALHFATSASAEDVDNELEEVAEQLRQQSLTSYGTITSGPLTSIANVAETVVVIGTKISEALAHDITPAVFQEIQNCALSCKAMLLLSRGASGPTSRPDGALNVGLARSLRLEQPSVRYVTLDLEHTTHKDVTKTSALLAQLFASETFDLTRNITEVDYEYAERQGRLVVNRLFPNEALEEVIVRTTGKSKPEPTKFLDRSCPMKAEIGVQGLLETFRWVDDVQHTRSLAADEIRIECRAASINFRDVLIAAGELGGSATMMNDCAGTVVEVGSDMKERFAVGDRVCSYYAQSYNNYPIVEGDHCCKIPESVSYALGASLPIVWATTYHSLVNVAKVKPGESVLIHAAAGAVGQAAVILAQHLGAVVFATCGSAEKRARLEALGVDPGRIFTSRSAAFGAQVRAATGNKGVNVILNSLAGELFRESLECLASFGRFVEIGKKDFLDDALMPTKFLLRNITFACVDLVQMIAEDKSCVRQLLSDVVELIASNKLRDQVTLLPYKLGEIETAFRLISAGKHMGKVILTVDEDEMVPALPATKVVPALSKDATYVLVGGFGGLGVRMIRWLAERGARTIVVLSRSGGSSPAAKSCIAEMASRGVRVLAKPSDISSKQAVEKVLTELRSVDDTGPIRGVINAAMSLEDALFDTMTFEQWEKCLAPKVAGTRNLHELFPADMDFFIVLSSIAGISGHTAQANYTAACTYQDALMQYRHSQGLVGFAIDVGVVGDAGFVSEAPTVFSTMKRQGFSPISVSELLATLDYALIAGKSQCQATVGLVPEAGVNMSDWLLQRRIAHLVKNSALFAESGSGNGDEDNSTDKIRQSKTGEEALGAIGGAVLAQLSKLTVVPVDRILPSRTLDSYGVDSLVAVELRNWIVAMLAADVSLLLIREARSIEELIRVVASKSRLVPAKVQPSLLKLV